MEKNIKYRIATEDDSAEISELLRLYFHPDEPLANAMEPFEDNSNEAEFLISNLNNKTCIVATSGKQIIGTNITAPKGPNEVEKILKEATHFSRAKWGKTLILLADIEKDSNFFEKYKVNSALQVHGITVNINYRGKGIGQKLHEQSMENARKMGFPLYTLHATSSYSARLCENLKMDCVNICSVNSYRLPGSDKQEFFPPAGQEVIKSYAMRLK